MSLQCLNYYAGIGKVCIDRYPVTVYGGFYLTRPNYTIASAADIADETFIRTEIAAGNIFPIQNIKEVENQDVEDGIEETSIGEKIHIFEGNRGGMYSCTMPLESHKILRSYNGGAWRVIYIDINKTLLFTETSSGEYAGIDLGYFRVSKLATPSADGAVKSVITLQENDVDDIDKNGCYLNPTWNPLKLYGPTQVEIINSVVAVNAWTSTVKYVAQDRKDSDGLPIEEPIPGLTLTELVAKDPSGVVPAGYAIVESAVPGVYDCSATAFTEGSNQVVASVTSDYSSIEYALTS